MNSPTTLLAALALCLVLIEQCSAKPRRKGLDNTDYSLTHSIQRRSISDDSPSFIERQDDEELIERELSELNAQNHHNRRYVVVDDALGTQSKRSVGSKRSLAEFLRARLQKRGGPAYPGYMGGYISQRGNHLKSARLQTVRNEKRHLTSAKNIQKQRYMEPSVENIEGYPVDETKLSNEKSQAKSRRNILGQIGSGISGAIGGIVGGLNKTVHVISDGLNPKGSSTQKPGGVEDDDGLIEDLGEVIDEIGDEIEEIVEDVSEALNKIIDKAVETLDVALMNLNLNQLAKDLLGKVTNITLSPLDFLKKYGYVVNTSDVTHTVLDMVKGLLNFQHMYHISLTGILDLSTITAMLQPRCGMPDIITQASGVLQGVLHKLEGLLPASKRGEISKRHLVPGYRWDKKALTWKIHNFFESAELPQSTQRRAIFEALNYWDRASALTFTETTGTADLNIHFYRGDHQDGSNNAFDGPGGVLAHAFYPQSGEAHFDSAERFTDGTYTGINLKIVAAHEFGHAFGLGHSDVKGALMAPVYQGYEENYQLPVDDTLGIQKIYGSDDGRVAAQVTDPPKPTTTTRPPIVAAGAPPPTCSVPFRAVTQTHDYRIYAYYGRWMWRMSEYGLDDGYPVTIDSVYENPPDNIEAALFSAKYYYTYFFKGRDVWVYYGFTFVEKSTITTPGYPTSVQAATTRSDGTICVIQGGNCWVFNEDTFQVGATPLKLTTIFPGAPTTFDSMLRLQDDSDIFYFNGNNYLRYSEARRAVGTGYPKAKAGPWMGPACNAAPYTPK